MDESTLTYSRSLALQLSALPGSSAMVNGGGQSATVENDVERKTVGENEA